MEAGLAKAGFRLPSRKATRVVMADFMSHIAVPIAIGAVAVVLLLGLINMMRGGSGNTSQKLMRLRVLLQFIAIIVIMFTLWVMAK
jgi:Hypoxia induced protein conserved region